MRTRKRREEKDPMISCGPVDLGDTKVNHEPTDQQLREFIAKKKGQEITEREKVDTFAPIEQAGVKKPKIPQVPEEQPRKKFIISKMNDEELEMFNARNEWIREQRRKASIQKMLRDMAQNKYSPFIGKKVNIRGELYEVKPIERKSDKGRKSSTSQ
jgi:hypothetical protein